MTDRTSPPIHWRFNNKVSWRRGRMFHVRVLWFAVSRVPSWSWPDVERQYGRWGLWFRHGGFTARYRDWLVLFR